MRFAAATKFAFAVVVLTAGLAAPPPAAAQEQGPVVFPEEWFDRGRTRTQISMEGRPAPRLFLDDWVNGDPVAANALGGKIVVVAALRGAGNFSRPSVLTLNGVQQKYADEDVIVVGAVTGSSGKNLMEEVAREYGAIFPMGRDEGNRFYRTWRIESTPSFFVIDRRGVVRAVDLIEDRIDAAVELLLTEQPGPKTLTAELMGRVRAALGRVPGWERPVAAERRQRFAEMEGVAAPATDVGRWFNAGSIRDGRRLPQNTALICVGFWSPGDDAAVEKLNALHERYADAGLVVIGVAETGTTADLVKAMREQDVKFPVCMDRDATADSVGSTARLFGVEETPAFYLQSPVGLLVAADVDPNKIEQAAGQVLAELTGATPPPAGQAEAEAGEEPEEPAEVSPPAEEKPADPDPFGGSGFGQPR